MHRRLRLALAVIATTVLAVPVATGAQEPSATDPAEAVEWQLVTYLEDGVVELAGGDPPVTLILESGAASGSTGCRDYSTTYVSDDTSLSVEPPALDAVEPTCDEAALALEATFLASLARVTGYELFGRTLDLTDEDGSILLTFVRPALDVRSDELLALATTIGGLQLEVRALREELAELRIGALRERVTTVEEDVAAIREQLERQRWRDLRTRLGGIEITLAESIERIIEIRRRVRNVEARVDALIAAGAESAPSPAPDEEPDAGSS